MPQKTFILGVGCQKGGTSWLWDYLKRHPAVTLPPIKELHVFDTYFMPKKFAAYGKTTQSKLQKLLSNDIATNEYPIDAKVKILMQVILAQNDISQYPNIFADITENSSKQNSMLTGDITPSYCMLKREHYEAIKNLLNLNGFKVKIIFIMRDPIDRVLSALRMAERSSVRKPINNAKASFNKLHGEKRFMFRTEYNKVIDSLDNVFPAEDIFYGFYETLFSESTIHELCNFLEINYSMPELSKRVNPSPHSAPLDSDQIALARETYQHIYEFCAERFGQDFIKSIWPNY